MCVSVYKGQRESGSYNGHMTGQTGIHHVVETCVFDVSVYIKANKKVAHIMDIWRAGLGVVSLHVFQNVMASEAFTREACMIDAIGELRCYAIVPLGHITGHVRPSVCPVLAPNCKGLERPKFVGQQ